MSALDDTQPRSPLAPQTPPHGQPPVADEPRSPGCWLWGMVIAAGLGLALVIIVLAGAAGWTSGQREAQAHATATQQTEIQDQLARIPGDVASGNTVLLAARIEFLATQTPGVNGLADLVQTATAVYNANLPTETPLATATMESVATAEPEVTEFVPEITPDGNGYDLAALLEEARTALRLGQYTEAVDLLKAVEAVDPNYERAEVRGLMLEALTTRALRIYRGGGNLAEAILLTDEAEQYGLPADSELLFERYVAALYLNAKTKIGTSFPAAIQALQEAYAVAPNYRNGEIGQLLFGQHVAYGDAWVAEGNPCNAVGPYQSALSLFSDPGVSAKRDNAQTACQLGTPTGDQGTVAPVGVQG
jgi:hypothetical protein